MQRVIPKIAIYSFTGCGGEQLTILSCDNNLLELFNITEIKSFPMAQSSNSNKSELDIVFLEGSITTKAQQKRLQEIRVFSRLLVATGTCACFGGIQSMNLGKSGWKNRFRKVYGDENELFKTMDPFESKPCDAFVKIDHYIPGCPIEKRQFLSSIAQLLNGNSPNLYNFSVCTECKWRENECLLLNNILCLGPVTRAGCGAICPSHNLRCIGCWGVLEEANVASEYKLLLEKGFTTQEIERDFMKFGGAPMVERLKKVLRRKN